MKGRILAMIAVSTLGFLASASADVTPTDLQCEYAVDAPSIDTLQPRLSWLLASEERAQVQTAYRILVANGEEKLARGIGDLWDSGKVASDQSIHVPYGGKPLRSRMRAYWKVRVWDKHGKPSPYSQRATWRMGLLDPSDWKAKWVGVAEESSPPMLRKTFRLASPVKEAALYATALGLYELRLNGRRVGDHLLAPEWTDYNKRIQYQVFDVTPMLRKGDNAVGVLLGDGWYAGRIGISHIIVPDGPQRGFYGQRPWFLLQLEIEFMDGSKQVVVSDPTWKATTDGPIRNSCILDGEMYDARREMPGWDEPGFDDGAWKPVAAKEGVSANLVAQPNEPIRIVKELKPIALTEPTPGVYVFDLGQNMVGWCRFRLEAPAGTVVTLRHGEVLAPDGNIYTDNLRVPKDDKPGGAKQIDTYICRGDGEEVFEPYFTYHGFRYVEVKGLPRKPSLDSLTGCVFHSDAPVIGSFECSSPMLNKLMQNIFWTQRGNLHSTPTDCPQRDERMGWMGDAQIFSQTMCFNMNMARFFAKWAQDIRDAQADDGRYPDFAPHPFDPNARFSGAPAWADAGTIVPWRVYVNYGDARILEQHFESAKRWVEYVRTQSPEGVWTGNRGNNYTDWLNGDTLNLEGWPHSGGGIPSEILATAFYAHSTDLVFRMAAVLGRTADAKRYASLFDAIKAAFNREFVKPEGRIQGDAQSAYALALHFNLLPKDRRELAVKHLLERIEERNGHLSTGIQSTNRLMLELARAGHSDVAYHLLNQRTPPSWGYMVDHGATTIWERWDGYIEGRGYQNPGMNSFNHYAFGAVGEWIYRNIVGINPNEKNPGYKRFTVRPRLGGGLTWAKGKYESVHGTIASDWKIEGERFSLDVTVPVNTTATIYVPARDKSAVTESGKAAEKAEGITFLRMEEGAAVYKVGSGNYRFAASGYGSQ